MKWSELCETVFNRAKEILSDDHVLVHFDPSKPLVLSVDAIPYGIGDALCHWLDEHSIAFASRTLSAAKLYNAQIEREGLASIFGLTNFHLYLLGKQFTLITDHKPLTHIFGAATSS